MAISPVDSAPAAPQAPETPTAGPAAPELPPATTPVSAPLPSAGAIPPSVRTCAGCGAGLGEGQDWCLQCGAGAAGSLRSSGWWSAASVLLIVAVLALGAAAAAYAALNKSSGKPRVLTTTVAQTTPPPSGSPPSGTAGLPLGGTPSGTTTTPRSPGGLLGLAGAAKPPKIPLSAPTPKPASKPTTSTTKTPFAEIKKQPASTTPANSSPTGAGGESNEESQQAAILLDPDAASTYNPYELPASGFGDPSLAIDDDTTTAWTAEVNPATAPKMAEGLMIDLKSKQRVGIAQLVTSTPGMTVQVYGATTQAAPTSITDPAWVTLSHSELVKKKHLRIKLRHAKEAFTFIVLWISAAPTPAAGATAPTHVDVNEFELFPAR